MLQMLTKQDATYEKDWRITFFKDTRRTMARNQYQHYWSITEIQWKRHYYSHSGSIYKNGSTQGNNDKYIIERDCKDLSWWNMETTWGSKNNSQWQRTSIYIKIYERSHKSIGNKMNAINSILPLNRWTNRENQPRNWYISKTLHQLPTG